MKFPSYVSGAGLAELQRASRRILPGYYGALGFTRLDVDLSGSREAVVARLADHPALEPSPKAAAAPRGPGRPRLGVVSREVSLLPRHWEWLSAGRGGASATLRRLVDAARKANAAEDVARRATDAAHRFLWDIAGDQPGFEEAARALFAHDFDALEAHTAVWSRDLHDQLGRFLAPVRAANASD